MTEFGAGSDGVEPGNGEWNTDEKRIAQLLTELAVDPAAPPTGVTALSVIAAAKAAGPTDLAAASRDRPVTPDEHTEPGGPGQPAELIRFRPRRRRFALAGLVAAASLAGLSVLVISLTVSGGSSTSTSADGARAASSSSFDSPAAAELAAPPAADALTAETLPSVPSQAAAGAAAPDSSAAAGASGPAASGQAADASAAGCWPALSDRAVAALTDVLPPGAYDSPLPLTADCEPGAVGGVILPGTAQGTALVVRVSAAVPGACVSDTSGGTACVARGDNVYQASDAAGSPVVYAYRNGNQVVVSGWPAAGDSVAIESGLTVDQSVAAAEAVLGAFG